MAQRWNLTDSGENPPVEAEQGFGTPDCSGSALHHSPGWPSPPICHPMGPVALVLRTLFIDTRTKPKKGGASRRRRLQRGENMPTLPKGRSNTIRGV